MDKDLKKILNDLGEFLDKHNTDMSKMNNEKLKKANRFKISAEKNESGVVTVEVKGTAIAVLQGLAGLEKTLLREFNVDNEIWEIIKKSVSTEDVNE